MESQKADGAVAPTMKLGDIVINNPSLAIEFEIRGLDYCCQGARTLADAANDAGLDPQQLANELTNAMVDEPKADWTSLSLADLVRNIEDVHHQYLWETADRTSALVEKIASVHGGRHPELLEVKRIYEAIRADIEPHMKKEEELLFPTVKQFAQTGGSAQDEIVLSQIRSLSTEHEVVGELLADLHKITDGYTTPADGCATYAAAYQALNDMEKDIHEHIHKENNVLFPALKTEEPSQWGKSREKASA